MDHYRRYQSSRMLMGFINQLIGGVATTIWTGLTHAHMLHFYGLWPMFEGENVGQFQNFMVNIWLVVSTIFYVHNIWDVILPIDELHHFSRWLLHHQPDDTWSIWIHFSGWAKLQVRRNWLSDPGNTEHSSWCRWEIPELEV